MPTVEEILDDDSLSFKQAQDKIFSQPYFKGMYKDIRKTIDSSDINHIVNMMNKYGYRDWFIDFFTHRFILNHFDQLNDIVEFHCARMERDLSMYRYPIRCIEFNIIFDLIIKTLLAENYIPKPPREPKQGFDPNKVIYQESITATTVYPTTTTENKG